MIPNLERPPYGANAASEMPPSRRAKGVALSVILALAATSITGCVVAGRPTIDEVRADTDAMMQRVADEVPGGVPEVLPSNSPYLECAENSFYYSTRWTVAPEAGFNGSAFIEALPDRLGDGFREFETVEVSVPAIALKHSSGMILDVQVIDLDGRTVVSLLGVSACGEGEPPAE
ncbi:hypothetical protein O1W71_12865 [Microbacterium sp. H37-C3]|uniref:hypothetical protein n=1 Tax=Microbacterium sp. H37-C3 TaxID=3004354 RepID=UPI0022B03E52|nr:hypothetical protein [Microbacterium sp. H37-C3]MCZ4068565.1 hypothetical protein [Microbacterium sp. H37-C3]